MVTAMGTLLAQLGEVVTATIGNIGKIVTEVIGNPLLLIGVGFALLGASVGLVKKFQ